MAVNPPIGVFLSEDELVFVSHLLISLKADDLITEEQRCVALERVSSLLLDIRRLRQDPDRSSVSQRSARSQ